VKVEAGRKPSSAATLNLSSPKRRQKGRLCLRPLPRQPYSLQMQTWSHRDECGGHVPTRKNSLILRKPTSTSESEGVVNSGILAHGGGVRFAKDSPEYLTILQWIKGAKE